MVARRLIDALRARDEAGTVGGHAAVRGAARAVRPRRAHLVLHRPPPRGPRPRRPGALGRPARHAAPRRAGPTAIDRDARTVTTNGGAVLPYDALVLATGSYAAVPPVPGKDLRGAFVYRTIDDVADLRACVEKRRGELDRPVRGAVVGGGLLGLEAAGALTALDVESTVVEFAPRLMPLQVDDGGGEALKRLIEALGVAVRTSTADLARSSATAARSRGWSSPRGPRSTSTSSIFAVGVRPRDELARDRRTRGRRARRCRRRRRLRHGRSGASGRSARSPASAAAASASSPPATRWPRSSPTGCSAAPAPSPAPTCRPSSSSSGSTSRASATRSPRSPGAPRGRLLRPGRRRLQEARHDRRRPDPARRHPRRRRQRLRRAAPDGGPRAGRRPCGIPASRGRRTGPGRRAARRRDGVLVQQRHRRCGPLRGERGRVHRPRRGQGVHQGGDELRVLPAARQEARHDRAREVGRRGEQRAVRALRPVARAAVRRRAGRRAARRSARSSRRTGAVAAATSASRSIGSILASLGTGHILEGERATLQDTNDHVMANLQKDGSYSVVPRIPGGEITPEGLIVIGEVAQGLRALHEDHRRPADRPLRRAHRAAAPDLEAARRRRLRVRATPTASRCAR